MGLDKFRVTFLLVLHKVKPDSQQAEQKPDSQVEPDQSPDEQNSKAQERPDLELELAQANKKVMLTG